MGSTESGGLKSKIKVAQKRTFDIIAHNPVFFRVFGAIMLFVCLLFFYLQYASKTFPFTDGWGVNYVELMKAGQVPYRDFYFYLPPANLWVDFILWSLSGQSFLVYRYLRVFERILLMEILYLELSRHFKPVYAFFGCLIGGVLRCANVYDLFGDYNQTVELLVVVIGCCAARFVETKNIRTRYILIGICGFLDGFVFLMKQSHFIACSLAFLLFLVCYCIAEKDKRFLKYAAFTVLGLAVPVGITVIVLLAQGAFMPFLQQVFLNVSQKGSLIDLLVTYPLFPWLNYYTGSTNLMDFIMFALLFLSIGFLVYIHKTGALKNSALAYVFGFIGMGGALYYYFWRYSNHVGIGLSTMIDYNSYWVILLPMVGAFAAIMLGRRYKFVPLLLIPAVFMFCSVFVFGNWNRAAENIVLIGLPTLLLTPLTYFLYFFTFVLFIYGFYQKMRHGEWKVPASWLALTTAALGCGIANAMASSQSGLPMFFISNVFPLFYCVLFGTRVKEETVPSEFLEFPSEAPVPHYPEEKTVKSSTGWKALESFALALSLIVCFFIAGQKERSAYVWHGWADTSLSKKTETVDLPELSGFQLGTREKVIYEQITKVIVDNTESNDVVWSFPHVPVFNVLSHRHNTGGFVPVYFFDVCSDKYASEDAIRLRENEPKMVIWCDIGKESWDVHELYFRNGKRCGQRDIQEWFVEAKYHYELVGQVENVFVYLQSNYPVQYSYIQNPNRVNETAEEKNCRYA